MVFMVIRGSVHLAFILIHSTQHNTTQHNSWRLDSESVTYGPSAANEVLGNYSENCFAIDSKLLKLMKRD